LTILRIKKFFQGVLMSNLVEKTICLKCGIVFPKADECPRCGKKDSLDVYLEMTDQIE
jgi:uncharacterized OB-fold protein